MLAVINGENIQKETLIAALWALGAIGDMRAAPAIIEKAKTDNVEVKEAALRALGMLGDPRAEDCLMETLENPDPRIRMRAVESLGKI